MNYRQRMLNEMESSELREQLVRIIARWRRVDRTEAEDAVQDAYLYAVRTKSPWDGRCKLRTWLTRVAINAMNMRGRRLEVLKKHEAVLDETMNFKSEIPSPYDRVLALERLDLFEDVIFSEMSTVRRSALLLLVSDPEQSYNDAAKKLQIPGGTFKARVHRARQQLEAVL